MVMGWKMSPPAPAPDLPYPAKKRRDFIWELAEEAVRMWKSPDFRPG